MASNKELREQLSNERMRAALLESERDSARADAVALRIDNQAHRARESARLRSDHAAEQRKLKEAEREDARKRRQELASGVLRYSEAEAWSIHSCDDGSVSLEVHVKLSKDVEPIVHGVLAKKDAPNIPQAFEGNRITASYMDELLAHTLRRYR